MNSLESDPAIVLDLDPIERWNVFNRLQDLSIPCQCRCGEPLRVEIASPAVALQVWSVVRRLTLSRDDTVAALEHCWKQVAYR